MNDAPISQDNVLEQYFEGMVFPLKMRFRVMALATQASITDAEGKPVLYTKQKLFKFREHVEVFTDSSRQVPLAEIKADKIIDWSARYVSRDARGEEIGAVGRRGWRSLWRAHYEVFNPGDKEPDFSIREENPMAKVIDGVVGEIPIVGMATGYLFHPRYLATRQDGTEAMRLSKKPAFFEACFEVEKLGEVSSREQLNLLLSFMMMILLERKRG